MGLTTSYDPRLSEWAHQLKNLPTPQQAYYDGAKTLRAEREPDGAIRLYRQEDILKIVRHHGVLGTGGRGGMFAANPLIPLEIDGADHRKWRRLLDPLFSPKRVAALESSVRQLARELIDNFAGAGEAELFEDFCVPLPCLTFLRLVGIPVADLNFFLGFMKGVIHPDGDTADEINASVAASGARLAEYFAGYLAEKRKAGNQSDDVISYLINSEIDGQPVSDQDLLSVLFLLMFAGLDTVTSSMSLIFTWLGQHPAERDRLVRDRSLIPSAVEELLRYETPAQYGIRYATEDIDLGEGLVIEKGEAILAVWAAANVDPAYFEDPLRVDFDRGRRDHMVFASGPHRCLGSHLARLELRIAVEEILDRIGNYSIGPDDCVRYDNMSVRKVERLPITFSVPAATAGPA